MKIRLVKKETHVEFYRRLLQQERARGVEPADDEDFSRCEAAYMMAVIQQAHWLLKNSPDEGSIRTLINSARDLLLEVAP